MINAEVGFVQNQENNLKYPAKILTEIFNSFLNKEISNNVEVIHFNYEDSTGEGVLSFKLLDELDLKLIIDGLDSNPDLVDNFEWDFSSRNNKQEIKIDFKVLN